MAIRDKYFPGSTVSRYLPPGEHSWDEAVYQSGKPVLDAELNLSQEVGKEIRRLIQHHETPSGWLRGPIPFDAGQDFSFGSPSSGVPADSFYMTDRTAIVAQMPVKVAYTESTDPANLIQLDPAPVNGGTPPDIKRTDFVFLEVFRALVSPSPHSSGTILVLQSPTTGTINFGTVVPALTVPLTPTGGAARTSGGDDYNNTLGSAAAIAAEIRDAINDPANSFAAYVTAQIDVTTPEQINVRASDAFAGAAGDNILFTETSGGVDFTLNPLVGNLTGGVDTPNKPTQATIYRNGNVLAPAGVNLPDEIADPTIGTESTKRVQIQYNVRKTGSTEAVNFQVTNGFIGANWIAATTVPGTADSQVQAQATQVAPVARYRFVPADGVTVLAYIEVTGVGAIAIGDTIEVNGVTLTAANPVVNPDEFDPTGAPAAIATSIVAAITASVATVASSASGSLVTVVPATLGNNVTLETTLTTSTSVITAVNSAVSYQTVDNGLYIAGDGTQKSADDLGTVDGYSYAIPMCFVFRRNDASLTGGFDPANNTNGALAHDHPLFANTHGIGSIPANTSDRPDQRFHDVIVRGDILDLRRQVSPGGVDLKAELESQMTALLDGTTHTWAIDTESITELGNGSGDVSSVYLVCNEIGDQDYVNGETIGTWDHIRRRFADQSVVERRIFPLTSLSSAGANPGLYTAPTAPGWQAGQVLNIDLANLDCSGTGDWSPTASPVNVTNQWPAGTTITNVLRVVHDDGHYATPISQNVEMDLVTGIGTEHVQITLAPNNAQANGGVNAAPDYDLVAPAAGASSVRRIFVELEITYPAGVGLSATPDEIIGGAPTVTSYHGAALEYDTSKRPTDFEDLQPPAFRPGYREAMLEYVCNDGAFNSPISEQVVTGTATELVMSRRFYGIKGGVPGGMSVTDIGGGLGAVPIDDATTTWGNSERKIVLTGAGVTPGAQSLVNVEYFAQDPIPDFSSPGDRYQIAVYYRSNAPQTVGVMAGFPATSPLPDNMGLQPLVMSRSLWTNTTSVGSLDLAFPYSNPSDQIAVNADQESGINPPFPGEWALMSLAKISVGDFDAETGLLNLHQMVPVDPNSDFSFSSRDWDSEFRGHYRIADVNAYRPTAMAQPLSGVATHKVFFPFLAQAKADNVYFRKGEVVLVVVSRYALLDGDNVVRFTDSGTDTCAAVYRTRGLLLLASER